MNGQLHITARRNDAVRKHGSRFLAYERNARIAIVPDVVRSREANALAQQRVYRAPLLRVYERSDCVATCAKTMLTRCELLIFISREETGWSELKRVRLLRLRIRYFK